MSAQPGVSAQRYAVPPVAVAAFAVDTEQPAPSAPTASACGLSFGRREKQGSGCQPLAIAGLLGCLVVGTPLLAIILIDNPSTTLCEAAPTCETTTCGNDGRCQMIESSPYCHCTSGWTGPRTEPGNRIASQPLFFCCHSRKR